jgi:hypothetical protein
MLFGPAAAEAAAAAAAGGAEAQAAAALAAAACALPGVLPKKEPKSSYVAPAALPGGRQSCGQELLSPGQVGG